MSCWRSDKRQPDLDSEQDVRTGSEAQGPCSKLSVHAWICQTVHLKRDLGVGTSVRVISYFQPRIVPFRNGLNDRETKPGTA